MRFSAHDFFSGDKLTLDGFFKQIRRKRIIDRVRKNLIAQSILLNKLASPDFGANLNKSDCLKELRGYLAEQAKLDGEYRQDKPNPADILTRQLEVVRDLVRERRMCGENISVEGLTEILMKELNLTPEKASNQAVLICSEVN